MNHNFSVGDLVKISKIPNSHNKYFDSLRNGRVYKVQSVEHIDVELRQELLNSQSDIAQDLYVIGLEIDSNQVWLTESCLEHLFLY